MSAMACAKSWSLSGSRLRSVGSTPATSRMMERGDRRSASAKSTSKAMAAAPMSDRRCTRSASRSRGHGHWPNSRSDASSISMTRTGVFSNLRGVMRWYSSKVMSRIWRSSGGSVARSSVKLATSARPRTTPIFCMRVMIGRPPRLQPLHTLARHALGCPFLRRDATVSFGRSALLELSACQLDRAGVVPVHDGNVIGAAVENAIPRRCPRRAVRADQKRGIRVLID